MSSVSKMGHTFLFEEGRWKAEGFFRDARGHTVLATAETCILHSWDRWVMEGFIEIEGEVPRRIENRYLVEPFDGRDITSWTSENPALGTLRGTFTIVGDSILSCYSDASGEYGGMEYLRFIDGDSYINRGALLKEGELVSSWSVTLRRV
ncbi:MAG: hypothetical protein ACP5DY_07615 [Thermovirgaceae bacterium]